MITTIHRLIGGLGRALTTIGALVLAFAAFQYWGTGLAEARAQEHLGNEFLTQLASARNDADAVVDPGDPNTEFEPDTDPPELVDPLGRVERPIAGSPAPMLDPADVPEPGEAAGRIIIPAIEVDKTYVQGVGRDDLRKGPGHYPLTAFPGQRGNAAIAGHRTTYGAPFFDLDKLQPGDEIIVETLQGRFTYLVNEHETDDGIALGHFVVDPTATWVLDDHGDSRLTLTACHPKRSAARRIVVTATLDTTPAPPTPVVAETSDVDPAPDPAPSEPDPAIEELPAVDEVAVDEVVVDDSQSLDESLGWQPEHWPATALWSALSTLTATAGWLLGHRWRRAPACAVTAIPFLGCLFVCFTHLDKLLPAI
ncbi:MAG: sortase [Acidimicrobiia bacterium]|nr:sortase [Acidimicrobiia bacterium]